MLELREYTKQEIDEYFHIKAKETRKLDSEGYSYTTSGRGATYRITITAQMQTTLSSFAKQY